MRNTSKPFIHSLYNSPLNGEEIETKSFAAIEAAMRKEVSEREYNKFSISQRQIIRRMIHTGADFRIIANVHFSKDAIDSGIRALKNASSIYVDSNMISAGISLARLRSVNKNYTAEHIKCHVRDQDVAAQAHDKGLPRAIFALRKAKKILGDRFDKSILVFGNSPVGLLELNRMIIEEKAKPALVIGMPVGFVHVEESKEELLSLKVPQIVLKGPRGGSPFAVSVIHAISILAREKTNQAIILLGHGSRIHGAGESMQKVAIRLSKKFFYKNVEICYLSRLKPHFPETFAKCILGGANEVIVVPYFLHTGLHMRLDIPKMLQDNSDKYPHVKVILAKELGYDESLVDIVKERIEESKDFSDIREMVLPDEGVYPVPKGQHEFVPMSPEMVPKWKKFLTKNMAEENE